MINSTPIRLLLTAIVFIASLGTLAVIGFFAVMFLAGPHGGVLPEWLHRPFLFVAWVIVIGLPVWLAVIVYKRMKCSI